MWQVGVFYCDGGLEASEEDTTRWTDDWICRILQPKQVSNHYELSPKVLIRFRVRSPNPLHTYLVLS